MHKCPIATRVAALRHLSTAYGAPLPPELCLSILLHWDGMRHPAATVFLFDPQLRRFIGACNEECGHGTSATCEAWLGCECGLWDCLSGSAHYLAKPNVRSHLAERDTFRPTRMMVSHLRRITLNAEGGYRDRRDWTLDRFGQAWCGVVSCALSPLWFRAWHNAHGTRPGCVVDTRAREFSLVEFLRRAPHTRVMQDYYGLTGKVLPYDLRVDKWSPMGDLQPERVAMIRDILAADTESHGVQQHACEDPTAAASQAAEA